jgi:ABC-type dipeptide/oligopeptide/nickel transport system permease subunit
MTTEGAVASAQPVTRRRSESAGGRAVRRFMHHRAALVGMIALLLIAFAAIFGPIIYGHDPDVTDLASGFKPPDPNFLLGRDSLGRDLLARLLVAGRVSLSVGLAAAFSATVLGLIVGLLAGTFSGWVDTVLMRLTDITLAMPTLIAVAVVVGIIGPSLGLIVLFIGLFQWPYAARVVRSVVLSLREQDFVLAARALGATNLRIIRRHLLFHALAPLTVTGTFTVAIALLTEAGLSFIGIGIAPPQASWGNMLADAEQLFILRQYPWYWLPPGIAIFATVLAVNLVGDGLRDALDPHG